MSDILDRVLADKAVDEQSWLDARRKGVTATEVAQLARGGASNRETLLSEKRTGERSFMGNAYTAWGLEREPVIAEWIRGKFGHQPSDALFHAPDNRRHLATPDGLHIKDGLVTIAEIKTSKDWLEPGTDAFLKTNYAAQMQWQMYVADVHECLFVWEQRLGEPGAFEVGERGHAWIERDNGHITELVRIADGFINELDNGTNDDPDDYAQLVSEYLRHKSHAEHSLKNADMVAQQIRERIGDREQFSISTTYGKVTLSTPKPTQRFDSTAFKEAEPDLYRAFVKETQAKPSLRITPPKEGAENVF